MKDEFDDVDFLVTFRFVYAISDHICEADGGGLAMQGREFISYMKSTG